MAKTKVDSVEQNKFNKIKLSSAQISFQRQRLAMNAMKNLLLWEYRISCKYFKSRNNRGRNWKEKKKEIKNTLLAY